MANLVRKKKSKVKSAFSHWLSSVRPWNEFFDSREMSAPDFQNVIYRIKLNLTYFQSNYLIIIIASLAYALLLQPTLLLFITICMLALVYLSIRQTPFFFHIQSTQFLVTVSQATITVLTICPAFLVWWGGRLLFSMLSFALFLNLLHASCHQRESLLPERSHPKDGSSLVTQLRDWIKTLYSGSLKQHLSQSDLQTPILSGVLQQAAMAFKGNNDRVELVEDEPLDTEAEVKRQERLKIVGEFLREKEEERKSKVHYNFDVSSSLTENMSISSFKDVDLSVEEIDLT